MEPSKSTTYCICVVLRSGYSAILPMSSHDEAVKQMMGLHENVFRLVPEERNGSWVCSANVITESGVSTEILALYDMCEIVGAQMVVRFFMTPDDLMGGKK